MAAAPGNRGERPACRFCDRPATQLAHPDYKELNHNYLKQLRQPATLRSCPERAVCDSHLDSHYDIANINAGVKPEPKSEVSCPDCGEKMRNLEMGDHATQHKVEKEANRIVSEEQYVVDRRRAEQGIHRHYKERHARQQDEQDARVEAIRNFVTRLGHLADEVHARAQQHIRRNWPKTGENYEDYPYE